MRQKKFRRHLPTALSLVALSLVMSGGAEAARDALVRATDKPRPNRVLALNSKAQFPRSVLPFRVAGKPRRGALLRLNRRGRFPASVLPRRVPLARNAQRLGGRAPKRYFSECSADTRDMGTWCLMTATVELTGREIGRGDYFFAVRRCGEMGGYLPSAEQLLGAADLVKLSSTHDDSPVEASVDEDPTDGTKDRREMSGSMITTAGGSSAGGSLGVTPGSRGDPRRGEPDPPSEPSDPAPETLQYLTVFDNRNRGGFAGGKPVGEPERFRCAFNKAQPGDLTEIG